MANFRPLVLLLGPRQRNGPKLGLFGGSPGPSWAFYRYFQRSLASGFVRGHVAHIGLVLGPTSAPDPTKDQVAHAKPNLHPNVRHVGPQLGSSWVRVWRKLGPSPAQVSSCSPRLKAKDGQGLTPLAFWLGEAGLLLSSLSYSLGAGGSRREAT